MLVSLKCELYLKDLKVPKMKDIFCFLNYVKLMFVSEKRFRMQHLKM